MQAKEPCLFFASHSLQELWTKIEYIFINNASEAAILSLYIPLVWVSFCFFTCFLQITED